MNKYSVASHIGLWCGLLGWACDTSPTFGLFFSKIIFILGIVGSVLISATMAGIGEGGEG